jgi:hypothetical protein
MKCLLFEYDRVTPWTPLSKRAVGSENHKLSDFDNGTSGSIGSDTIRSGPNYTKLLIDQSIVSFNRINLVSNNKNMTLVQE